MFFFLQTKFSLIICSTGEWVESKKYENRGLIEKLSLRPGAPCDNFQGYCDVFLKCRQVNIEIELFEF